MSAEEQSHLIKVLGDANVKEANEKLDGHQTEMIHLRYKHSSMSAKAEAVKAIDLGVSETKRGTLGVQNDTATE